MKIEYPHFHQLKKAIVVTVVEGDGTKDSVAREVHYVYDENLNEVGIIDKWKQEKYDQEI